VDLREQYGHSWTVKGERYLRAIDPYVDRLMEVFEASDNYADEEIQPDRRRLLLYGVGEPTPEVAAIIAEAPDMLEVVWRHAPYTCAELCAEMERLMEEFPQILMGDVQDGGAGLEFGTLDRRLLGAEDARAMLGTPYPVTITYDQPVPF
jgi:hypothetical protein